MSISLLHIGQTKNHLYKKALFQNEHFHDKTNWVCLPFDIRCIFLVNLLTKERANLLTRSDACVAQKGRRRSSLPFPKLA